MTPIQHKIDLKFEQLLANGANRNLTHLPVLRLYRETGGLIKPQWLLSEIDPNDPTQAFGLCDTGHGFPKLGMVSLSDFWKRKQVNIDVDWTGHYPILVYMEAARLQQRITLDERHLQQAAVTIYQQRHGHRENGDSPSQWDDNIIRPLNLWKSLGPVV